MEFGSQNGSLLVIRPHGPGIIAKQSLADPDLGKAELLEGGADGWFDYVIGRCISNAAIVEWPLVGIKSASRWMVGARKRTKWRSHSPRNRHCAILGSIPIAIPSGAVVRSYWLVILCISLSRSDEMNIGL